MKRIDLTGQKFGRWKVIERDYSKGTKNAYWSCQCDCGNVRSISSQDLRDGTSVSCGCDNTRVNAARDKQRNNIAGKEFGYWTVIERDLSRTDRTYWICRCRCGVLKSVLGSSLTRGLSQSCGCKPRNKPCIPVIKPPRLSNEEIKCSVANLAPNHMLLDIRRNKGLIEVLLQCAKKHPPYWIALGSLRQSETVAHGCQVCWGTEKRERNAKYSTQEIVKLLSEHDMEFVEQPKSDVFYGVIEYRCKKCGHISKTRPVHLKNGRKCRNCLGLLKRTPDEYKEFVAQTDPEYEVLSDFDGVANRVLMLHKVCGTQYWVTPNNFQNGKRCPSCHFSKGEKAVENFLVSHNIQYIPQYRFDDCVYKRPLRFDFYLPFYNLCIEFQGRQHFESIPVWGGDEAFQIRVERDGVKREYCKRNNIHLLEVTYAELERMDIILSKEIRALESRDTCDIA